MPTLNLSETEVEHLAALVSKMQDNTTDEELLESVNSVMHKLDRLRYSAGSGEGPDP